MPGLEAIGINYIRISHLVSRYPYGRLHLDIHARRKMSKKLACTVTIEIGYEECLVGATASVLTQESLRTLRATMEVSGLAFTIQDYRDEGRKRVTCVCGDAVG